MENTHPFPIYEENSLSFNTDIAFCHNGTLTDYKPNYYNAGLNDTQIFGKYVLRLLKKGFEYQKDTLFLISELVGDYNKLCFLNKNNRIVRIGTFYEDNGYYYSNHSYTNYYEYYSFDNYSYDF